MHLQQYLYYNQRMFHMFYQKKGRKLEEYIDKYLVLLSRVEKFGDGVGINTGVIPTELKYMGDYLMVQGEGENTRNKMVQINTMMSRSK